MKYREVGSQKAFVFKLFKEKEDEKKDNWIFFPCFLSLNNMKKKKKKPVTHGPKKYLWTLSV